MSICHLSIVLPFSHMEKDTMKLPCFKEQERNFYPKCIEINIRRPFPFHFSARRWLHVFTHTETDPSNVKFHPSNKLFRNHLQLLTHFKNLCWCLTKHLGIWMAYLRTHMVIFIIFFKEVEILFWLISILAFG